MVGLGLGCRSVWTSLRTLVSSCIASSSVKLSAVRAMISDQILLSALRSSAVLTVLRPVSGRSAYVHKSKIFLSNALIMRKWAQPQVTMALRNTVCVLLSHAGLRDPLSTCRVGVSSKSALLISCASVLRVRAVRASMSSWYCRANMRNCHGTHLIVGFAVLCFLHRWARLRTRKLGIES